MIAVIVAGFVLFLIIGFIVQMMTSSGQRSIAHRQSHGGGKDAYLASLIDQKLNTVIGVQHAWAQEHWHKLGKSEKISWVKAHRHDLHITTFADSLAVIQTMQAAVERVVDASVEPIVDNSRLAIRIIFRILTALAIILLVGTALAALALI